MMRLNAVFLSLLLFSQSSLSWVWLQSPSPGKPRVRVDSTAVETPAQASKIDWKVFPSTVSTRPKTGVFPFFMEGEDQGSPVSWACTAFLVQSWVGVKVPPNAPAYLLTNGHCLNTLDKPDRFILKTKGGLGKFREDLIHSVDKVEWSVNTPNGRGSDMAVLSLKSTAKALLNEGYEFYSIAPLESVKVGTNLTQYAWRTKTLPCSSTPRPQAPSKPCPASTPPLTGQRTSQW